MYQQSGVLPRRTFLGAELKRYSNALSGLLVLRVVPGGAASAAGLHAGDVLLSINGWPVNEPSLLMQHIRALREGSDLRLEAEREGVCITLSAKAAPLPLRDLDPRSCDIELGHLNVLGFRRRTFLAMPKHIAAPRATVLYLQGLGNQPIELSEDPDEPLRGLFQGFCDRGFASLRVERRGVGDSEGPGCEDTDLFDEIASYREALAMLQERPEMGPIVLFGHSVGGMIAPLLLNEQTPAKAAVVFGTSAHKWVDCMLSATRRQRELAGLQGDALEHYVGAWAEMHHEVCRNGLSPELVFEQFPHLAWLRGSSCHGATMFGRHVAFFQQLERVNLSALWKTVPVPTLVLHGSYDWAAPPEHGRTLAELLNAADPGRARHVELDGTGHDFRRHSSLELSYQKPREGYFDTRVLDAFEDFWSAQIQGSSMI